ncbi:hypothetical protein APHAL10511_003583 [Amanita phalloides]|nr:hypothetical protein APHAL10511_003583 [Amanita phalloides]
MQCAEWWLARAKTLPVTIKICQFADISFSTLRHFLLAYHLKMLHFPIHSSGLDPSIPLHSIVYDLPLKHLAHLEEIRIRSWDHTYHIDLCAILKAAPNIRRVRFPRGGVRLSREALDDLAQCRLAPHLEWLTTGVVADPHDFLEMVKDRQKYVKEFRDTRLRPSLLRYLSISVDHTCDPKEIRIILASLGIKFRLLTG